MAKEPAKVKETAVVDATYTAEQVKELDEKGYQLVFRYELDNFLKLPDTVVEGFGHDNKVAYHVARVLNEQAERQKESPHSGIEVTPPQRARATARLEVRPKDPKWRDKWHEFWCAPYELGQRLADGYQTVSGDEVDTFVKPTGGVHKVAANGRDELVLLKIPKDTYDERERILGEKSVASIRSNIDQAREVIERTGAKVIEESSRGDDDDPRFRKPPEEVVAGGE